MKKIISLIFLAALIFTLSSCEKNRKYDEEELFREAETLVEKSKILNEIYWGEGISYIDDDSLANGYYYMADPASLYKYGFDTIDELKSLTKEVFTKEYSESIFKTALSAINDATSIGGYTRYFQDFECIRVYKKATVFLTDKVEYDYGTLKVKKVKGEKITVSVKATVIRDEMSQTRECEIVLIEEENGFRIDTPTYLVYREEANN